jgi:hypothetical protein
MHTIKQQPKNTFMKKYTILLMLLAATIIQLKAQMTVNAGPDTIMCGGATFNINPPVVTGGTPPYTYNWSPAQLVFNPTAANPQFYPVNPTMFTLTVTDANGGIGVDSIFIDIYDLYLTLDIIDLNPACKQIGQMLNFQGVINGGPYQQFPVWLFLDGTGGGNLNGWNVYDNPGMYTIQFLVNDTNDCINGDTMTLSIVDSININISSVSDGALPDTVFTAPVGGGGNYNYTWNSGETTQNILVNTAGQYCVTVADVNGCMSSACINAGPCSGCVWPGDANYDGIVDNNDLLAIGLGYGTNGSVRANASIVFTAQPATDWTDTLADGTNYKHIDCNGNGTINGDDTTAILQNYNLTHPRSGGVDEWRGGIPALVPQISIDTAFDGSSITVNFLLGDATNPVTDAYGLAFNLNYDVIAVDTNLTSVTFGNSWLGNATDKISIGKDQPSQGQLHLAVTRIDQTNRSGNGAIGSALFVITTDNINGKDYYNFRASISDVVMIDNNGQLLSVNAGADSALVEYEPLGISGVAYTQINIMPNPTNNFIRVGGVKAEAGEVNIYNIAGALVKQVPFTPASNIDVSGLQNGMYFIEVKTNNTTYKGKFNKIGG